MGCGQRLPSPSMLDMLNKNKSKVFEFKDGFYCEKCAKAKANISRKGDKNETRNKKNQKRKKVC